MEILLWTWLPGALQAAFNEIFLPEDKRVFLTWSKAPESLAYVGPFLLLVYLSRRRNTELLRVLLLPVIVLLALQGTFRYGHPYGTKFMIMSWLRSLAAFSIIAMSLDLTFSRTSRLKVGETQLPAIGEKREASMVPQWLADIVEVLANFRGIGWNFGKDVYIPPHPEGSREHFLWSATTSNIKHFLLVDLVKTTCVYLPGIGDTMGDSMFYQELPPLQRYAVSTFIHLLVGAVVQAGVEGLYSIFRLLGVKVFGQSPDQWPPVYDSPWRADSLHDFWARRWHQVLRRTFIVLGGIPGGWIGGDIGRTLGTFIASGLFHELGMYMVCRGLDHKVTFFFALQGVGVLLERLYRKLTGHRVGGWPGRIWVAIFILGFGQVCTDSWLRRGLGAAELIQDIISPLRGLVIPMAKHFQALYIS